MWLVFTIFTIMKAPTEFRLQIPLFYNKTKLEFQKDPYERYDKMVVRQTALHLADELWGKYPFQKTMDFATPFLPDIDNPKIIELGCGVGRWIATLAMHYPNGQLWGIDYSYQMLKRANEFWIEGKKVILDLSVSGFPTIELQGHQLSNIKFGLAKAEQLPFDDNSQDVVLSSFLLDRLEDPHQGLKEMYRILRPGGTMILISPFNFIENKHWKKYHPPIRIFHFLKDLGFEVEEWNDEFILEEPLDVRGNVIGWKCVGLVGKK